MNIYTQRKTYKTFQELDIIDITDDVCNAVKESKIKNGLCSIAVIGSTAGIGTVEYEDGLISDLKTYFERIIPEELKYNHDLRWHDGNGHSHIRAAMFKSSQTFQVEDSKPLLGTWQQIILIDFDNKPRNRIISIKVLGE